MTEQLPLRRVPQIYVHLVSPMWEFSAPSSRTDPLGFCVSRCNELGARCTTDPAKCTCPTCRDDWSREIASKHLGYGP